MRGDRGGEACGTDGVRMQHGEEVGAAQELGAGRLEQQGETRATTGVSHGTVSPVFCNTINPYESNLETGRH